MSIFTLIELIDSHSPYAIKKKNNKVAPKTCTKPGRRPPTDTLTRDSTAEWAASDKDNGFFLRDDPRAQSGGEDVGKVLRRAPIGRGEGVCLVRSANQGRDFSTRVWGKRCAQGVRAICLPFIDHTHASGACDTLRTSRERCGPPKISM